MRIVIATTQVPFVHGGAEVHARNLQTALRTAGHQAETVAVPFKWYPPERMLDAMLACRLLDVTETNGRPIDRLIGLKFPAYLIPHPNKVLWILHQHRQAYEQWDHPLSDMVHFGNGREVRDAIRRADTTLIPEARAVFTNSRNVSDRLRRFCGLDSTPLYHPPDGADTFYCGEVEPYFYFPSRINASKRQHLAIQALAHAGGDVRLIISGESEDDKYYAGLQRETVSLGLEKRVEFLGRVSEVEKLRLYAHCLGVVYVPVDEDYGYVTLEGMLASKPIVTCMDSGGPLEFITDGGTGLVAAPEPGEIGRAMARLNEDRPRAASMGRAAREDYLRRNITWDAAVEALVSAK